MLRCYYPQRRILKLAISRYIEFHWYGFSAHRNIKSSYQGLKNIRNIMTYVSLRIDRWMTVIFVLRRVNVRKMLFLGILWTYINSVYFVRLRYAFVKLKEILYVSNNTLYTICYIHAINIEANYKQIFNGKSWPWWNFKGCSFNDIPEVCYKILLLH